MNDTSSDATGPTSGAVGVRWFFAVLLLVLAAVLVPLAVTGVWAKNLVTDTDRYVETVAPLASAPSIQRAVADRASAAVTDAVDVPGIVEDVVGPKGKVLAPPLEAAFGGVVDDVALRLTRSDKFEELWVGANRAAHATLVRALEGNDAAAPDAVAVDLSGTAAEVATKLESLGVPVTLTGGTADGTTLELYSSEQIGKVRGLYRLAVAGATVLPWVAVLLLVVAAFVAPDRRKGAVGAGVALAVGAAVLLVGIGVGRVVFVDSATSTAAAADLFDILLRFVRSATRALLALGVVVVVAGWAAGPGRAAVALRRTFGRAAGAAGGAAAARGADGGAVGRWAAEHRGVLRGAVGVLAAVVLVAWDRPTANVVVWLALAVVGALLVVEVLARSASVPDAVDG